MPLSCPFNHNFTAVSTSFLVFASRILFERWKLIKEYLRGHRFETDSVTETAVKKKRRQPWDMKAHPVTEWQSPQRLCSEQWQWIICEIPSTSLTNACLVNLLSDSPLDNDERYHELFFFEYYKGRSYTHWEQKQYWWRSGVILHCMLCICTKLESPAERLLNWLVWASRQEFS
jgi:hypothetical protein